MNGNRGGRGRIHYLPTFSKMGSDGEKKKEEKEEKRKERKRKEKAIDGGGDGGLEGREQGGGPKPIYLAGLPTHPPTYLPTFPIYCIYLPTYLHTYIGFIDNNRTGSDETT